MESGRIGIMGTGCQIEGRGQSDSRKIQKSRLSKNKGIEFIHWKIDSRCGEKTIRTGKRNHWNPGCLDRTG